MTKSSVISMTILILFLPIQASNTSQDHNGGTMWKDRYCTTFRYFEITSAQLASTPRNISTPERCPLSVKSTILRKGFPLALGEDSLADLLYYIVLNELSQCDLLLGFDKETYAIMSTSNILSLPNMKQILVINSSDDFLSVLWTSPRCRGYLLMVDNFQPLLNFTNRDADSWDYEGRYVIVAPSEGDLKLLVSSMKGKNTEHIIGIVKTPGKGRWSLFINQHYKDDNLQRINILQTDSLSKMNLFPDKFSDLEGVKLTITTFAWEPQVHYHKDKTGKLLYRYGIDIEAIETLARFLNFTIFYQEPSNGERWGGKSKNGSWSGMFGLLQRRKTDVAFPLYVAFDFLEILDYTIPYKFQSSCFSVKARPPLPRWQALSYPFHKWTWMSILVGFSASGPILYLLSWISRKFGYEYKAFHSLPGSFQCTVGMHLNESLHQIPRRQSTRIYILFLWLYCFIITIAYSTNLTAFMTVKKLPKQIDTIKELRESGNILIGVNNFYRDTFLASGNADLYDLAKHHIVIPDQEKIFSLIRKGGYGFPGNKGFLQFIGDTKFTPRGGESKLRIIKECYASHSSAIALQNHSPLRRKFNSLLDGFLNGGFVRRFYLNALHLRASILRNSGEDDRSAQVIEDAVGSDGSVPLSLDHLQGIFIILLVTLTSSIIVFLVEISVQILKSRAAIISNKDL